MFVDRDILGGLIPQLHYLLPALLYLCHLFKCLLGISLLWSYCFPHPQKSRKNEEMPGSLLDGGDSERGNVNDITEEETI